MTINSFVLVLFYYCAIVTIILVFFKIFTCNVNIIKSNYITQINKHNQH